MANAPSRQSSNDNESHYLNDVRDFRGCQIFCKRHAAFARNLAITNLILLIIPIFFAFVKKKNQNFWKIGQKSEKKRFFWKK